MQFYAETEPGLAGPRLAARRAPEPPPDEIGLEDIWRMVRRQWWVILLTFGVVVAATAAYTWTLTPVWRATALIRVDEQSMGGAAVLFPEMAGASDLETEMLVAQTRPVLTSVVESLSLNFLLREPAGLPRHFLFSSIALGRDAPEADYDITRLGPDRWRLRTRNGSGPAVDLEFSAAEPVAVPGGTFTLFTEADMGAMGEVEVPEQLVVRTLDFDHAVARLQSDVTVSRPDRMASLFRIAYEGTDRWMARNLVNEVAAAFIEQRKDVQKTEVRSTVAFLQDQAYEIQTQLEAAENALQAFREDRQVVALASEASEQIRRLAQLQTERTALSAERDALSNLLTDIRSAGGQAPDFTRLVAFPTFLQNPTFQNLVQSLTEAERSRTELRARWTESHPGVVALDQEIAQLKDRLGDIGQNYLRSLTDQIASLDAVLVRFGSDLEEIPARELQFARLERQATLLADLYAILQQRLKEAEVTAAVEDPSVRVVEPAVLPREPVKPRKALNMALASVMGLMTGLGLAFVRQALDKTLRADEDVGLMLGTPVLSRVPRLPNTAVKGPRSNALVTFREGTSLPAEAYRALRSSIFFADMESNGKRELVVTSPGARDGKSVTSCNLAIAFAQQGMNTLLVDADLRRSTLHLTFEMAESPGLAEYLQGKLPVHNLIRTTHVPNLMVVPAGKTPPNPAELLGDPRMDTLLNEARGFFDAIVFDSPPVLAVTDATILATKLKGVVLVVRSDQTHKQAAEDAVEQLQMARARVLGVVVNDTDPGGRYGYRHRYYNEYYGKDA